MASFRIKMIGLRPYKRKLINQRQAFPKKFKEVLAEVGKLAKDVAAGNTPVRTGATALKWKLVFAEINTTAKSIFSVTVDHPFNEDGAVHPSGRIVKDGDKYLLRDLEFGTGTKKASGMIRKATEVGRAILSAKIEDLFE